MTTVTLPQIHSLQSPATRSFLVTAAAPIKRVFTETLWPRLRMIPGYLIMTPYSATILLLVAISIGLGLEDPLFQE